ncbi:hypothetical protein J6590_090188 [Homalodisca vitripennis]|nr:hypothetical protein J6590_090188 [Homalodisca vitripennis]
MPRTYKRDLRAKHHRPVDEKAVKRALDAVAKGMSIRKAEEQFKISKSALHPYAKKARSGRESTFKKTALDSNKRRSTGQAYLDKLHRTKVFSYCVWSDNRFDSFFFEFCSLQFGLQFFEFDASQVALVFDRGSQQQRSEVAKVIE